ncbi:hypothetical protein Pta02_16480 [Planobispora takensis]|uniref:Uncharacterized protein n=1 Tax=Planobispora takensis TaxID=1367882 RepID=A0A8J3SWJ3_9ACTN|nr:hypothetical protein Pta02_16480 [Planobispora takensis]
MVVEIVSNTLDSLPDVRFVRPAINARDGADAAGGPSPAASRPRSGEEKHVPADCGHEGAPSAGTPRRYTCGLTSAAMSSR